jgi:plasmid stability protein
MISGMKTTISLDDRLFEAVKRRAAAEGCSVSAFIAAVLDKALKCDQRSKKVRPFRLVAVGGSGPYEGVDLDRPRELVVAEDERSHS